MVIDFHTHIFPDKIAKRTIDVLESNVERVQGERGHAVIGATLSDLQESMRTNGIAYSLVLPIATKPSQTPTINAFAEKVNACENIFSFGSLHPMQEDWEQALEDVKAKGLLGIKLHPEYQGCYVDEKETIQILEKCDKLGLYTVFHAGADIGMEPPVHCTPKRLKTALNYVNGDKIIAAHMGGWRMWEDVDKYLVKTPIMMDTAYVKDFLDEKLLVTMILDHGSEKILFATDSPWEHQGESAEYFKNLPVADSDKENILYKNAKKLLKIY